MKRKTIAAGLCLSSLLGTHALADDRDYGEGLQPLEPSRLLDNADGRYDHWTGIGHLESLNNLRCSAVLIDPRPSPDSTPSNSPAYVLSSGHCAFLQTGRVASDLEIEGQVEFNYFKDTGNQRKVFPLKRIVWSSVQGTDLALLELQAPLSQVIESGVQPLRLSQSSLDELPGREILTVSGPLTPTGYTMRVAACTVDGIANLVEQPYAWTHNLRNQCTDVLPGSSGGATLDRYTNELVGIIGTSTRGATPASRCFAHSPCEVNAAKPTWLAETNYSTPVNRLNACFANGVFSPELAGCQLLPANVLTPANPHYQKIYVRLKRDDEGHIIPAKWDFKFAIDSSHYVFKTTREPQRCQAPHRYSQLMPSQNAHIDAEIGSKPGIYTLCVVGVDQGQKLTPALRNNAFIHTVELIEQVPASEPAVSITLLGTGRHSVNFTRSLPGNDGHVFKFGPPESTRCEDPQGYKHAYGNFTIGPRLLPVKLCTKAKNAAGELSAPRTDLLPMPENS